MINIIYFGSGSKYANYLKDSIKRISRVRGVNLSNNIVSASNAGKKVAIHQSGAPLTYETLTTLLANEHINFVIGDSRGIRSEILGDCDLIFSVSSLAIPHAIEAAILAEQIEKISIQGD